MMKKIGNVSPEFFKLEERDDLQATFLAVFLGMAFLTAFLYRLFFLVRKGTPEYFETNGAIGTFIFFYLVFVFGYFPELLGDWKSAYRKLRHHQNLLTEEKKHLMYFLFWIICMVVFFGVVDFSFLGVRGGIPQIGSVALLSIWGLLGNIYRLRKANRQERKRKRDHEKHIEEIRSRRNLPPGKQK